MCAHINFNVYAHTYVHVGIGTMGAPGAGAPPFLGVCLMLIITVFGSFPTCRAPLCKTIFLHLLMHCTHVIHMIAYMCCQDLCFNKAERWKVCSSANSDDY